MTKSEIINAVSLKTGIEKHDVEAVLNGSIKEIKKANIEGEPVFIRGWGTFGLQTRAAKTARNISLNTAVLIPAKMVVKFKPSKEFAEAVTKNNHVKK